MLISQLESSWRPYLADEFEKLYFQKLSSFLQTERQCFNIFPDEGLVFNAFNQIPFHKTKVVILGQDPYHGIGQAHGLCFSVLKGVKPPPSLVNIFKEIKSDVDAEIPLHGDLTRWAQQGVLLLNATLTVREAQAGSHQSKGWEVFTDKVIEAISEHLTGVVFLLWGNYAQSKSKLINGSKHHILKSVHPSPLSAYRGFLACKHFSQTNNYLISRGKEPVIW